MKDNVGEAEYLNDSMFIQRGNALFHSLFDLAPTVVSVSLQMLS